MLDSEGTEGFVVLGGAAERKGSDSVSGLATPAGNLPGSLELISQLPSVLKNVDQNPLLSLLVLASSRSFGRGLDKYYLK